MKISIIIISYNIKKLLIECIESIYNDSHDTEIEIIVVDNFSIDDTVTEIRKLYPYILLIANQHNKGFPYANNQAITQAQGDIFLLLNPDTKLHMGALKSLHDFYSYDSKKLKIVGLNVRNSDGTRQNSVHPIPNAREFIFLTIGLSKIFNKSKYFNYEKYINYDFENLVQIGWVSGAALAFHREVFTKIGGFDENLFWAEDIDFCYRAYLVKIPIFFLPDSKITHYIGGSGVSNIQTMVYYQNISRFKFAHKHFGILACFILEFIMLSLTIFKLLIRSVQWMLFNNKSKSEKYILAYFMIIKFILKISISKNNQLA